jgi:carbon storage regulator
MLVLGRKENQSILIGDNIRITIVGRSGSSIRIGVQAPVDVRVLREECAARDRATQDEGASRQVDEASPAAAQLEADVAPELTTGNQASPESPIGVQFGSALPPERSLLGVPTLQTTLEGDLLEVITAVSGV